MNVFSAFVRSLPSGLAPGLLSVFVILVAGCGEDLSEEVPVGPNMSALASTYAEPSGTLTPETSGNLAEALSTRIGALEGVGGLGFLGGIIGGIGGGGGGALTFEPEPGTEVREQPANIGGTSLEGNGFLKIHHICKGWGSQSFPDSKDGIMDLIATFSDVGIAPVIWGAFKQCHYLLNEGEVLFNSAINIHTGQSFQGLTETGGLEMLFDLRGSVEIDGEPLLTDSEQLDFRVLGEGFEISLPVDDGSVIFFQGVDPECPDGSCELLGFRAGNGNFLCDAQSSICSNGQGIELPFSFVDF